MPKKESKTDTFNFGKGYTELEAIVQEFESREIDLEKDLPKFERGLELAQRLKQRLSEIENKVVKIESKFSEPGTSE
ncbi:MAG: exodeoxyribonuclease VII small subunit [Candidatus Andersenbacteria bacterium]|nr:exodeoxyribonuclease VII small subunit [Candidatus Andersenbacteria bacterium]MBI3250376.1 exodeoxyribonuclease VII small subunit [Candidatus Andersenbacteria bacterium]